MRDAGVPDPLVDRDAELIRLGLAGRQTDGVIAATDDDRTRRVKIFDQVVLADHAATVEVGAGTEPLQEVFVLDLVGL